MKDAGNVKNSDLLLVDGVGVSFEQARTALWTSLQEVAEERDIRVDILDDARLLRRKVNFLVRSLAPQPDLAKDNVVRLPFECEGNRPIARALRSLIGRAKDSEDGFVPISAPVYWVQETDSGERLRCSARFVITDEGVVSLLRSETYIQEATEQQPGRLEREEWISSKTLAGLVPFCERGFSFDDFLDELLESAE